MAEQVKSVSISVKGTILFPKVENGTKKWCLVVTPDTQAKLDSACALLNKDLKPIQLKDLDYNDQIQKVLNIKSNYNVPTYDKDKNVISDTLYHGAKVVASVVVKEYSYMGKKGLTAYAGGFVVLEQGQAPGTTFDSIMKDVEVDDI